MQDLATRKRVLLSLTTLPSLWLLFAILIGIRSTSIIAVFVVLIWSIPFLLLGWVCVGLPAAFIFKRSSTSAIMFLCVFGAVGGTAVMLLIPFITTGLLQPDQHDFLHYALFPLGR